MRGCLVIQVQCFWSMALTFVSSLGTELDTYYESLGNFHIFLNYFHTTRFILQNLIFITNCTAINTAYDELISICFVSVCFDFFHFWFCLLRLPEHALQLLQEPPVVDFWLVVVLCEGPSLSVWANAGCIQAHTTSSAMTGLLIYLALLRSQCHLEGPPFEHTPTVSPSL